MKFIVNIKINNMMLYGLHENIILIIKFMFIEKIWW